MCHPERSPAPAGRRGEVEGPSHPSDLTTNDHDSTTNDSPHDHPPLLHRRHPPRLRRHHRRARRRRRPAWSSTAPPSIPPRVASRTILGMLGGDCRCSTSLTTTSGSCTSWRRRSREARCRAGRCRAAPRSHGAAHRTAPPLGDRRRRLRLGDGVGALRGRSLHHRVRRGGRHRGAVRRAGGTGAGRGAGRVAGDGVVRGGGRCRGRGASQAAAARWRVARRHHRRTRSQCLRRDARGQHGGDRYRSSCTGTERVRGHVRVGLPRGRARAGASGGA